MPIKSIRIENYKSIKRCDIEINNITMLIGANGTGKTNILEAIEYFYNNLTESKQLDGIFDENNKYSNQIKITLTFDLSNFVVVSKSHTNEFAFMFEDNAEHSKYSEYFKSIISLVSSQKEKTISIQMSQIKGKGIEWSVPFQSRAIVKSLFPFFYVDVRNLDIYEWSNVWSILGELSKVSNSERKELENSLHRIIDTNPETSSKIKSIHNIFDSSKLNIVPETSKEFATSLSKIYFSGENIKQRGKSLSYFSTGTNSVKYIEVLLKSINEIAKNKLKEPVVLIDEPELSLHPNYIDELSDVIMTFDNKCKTIIATHSSRLVKNIISYEKISLYNVKLDKNYTVTNLMKKYQQFSPISKYRVLDDHINSYFSKGILFVEGETELELFSNPYLRILFPCLKAIDVFKAMSQEPILNIMNPRKTKSNIPYICLIDADKAYYYDFNKKQLVLRKEYFNNNNKELFQFRNKKNNSEYLKHLHSKIEKMEEKMKIHYYEPYFSCNDSNYDEFYKTVHKYLLSYGIFTLKTTVEGALVNQNNLQFSLDFLKGKNRSSDFSDFNEFLDSKLKTDSINIVRLIFNGKTDLLKSYKGVKPDLNNEDAMKIERVMFGKKASGWVSEFIDLFFNSILPDEVEKSPKGMKQYFETNKDAYFDVLNKFKYNFSELNELLSKICDIIS